LISVSVPQPTTKLPEPAASIKSPQ
jgi:hypothetical protein